MLCGCFIWSKGVKCSKAGEVDYGAETILRVLEINSVDTVTHLMPAVVWIHWDDQVLWLLALMVFFQEIVVGDAIEPRFANGAKSQHGLGREMDEDRPPNLLGEVSDVPRRP